MWGLERKFFPHFSTMDRAQRLLDKCFLKIVRSEPVFSNESWSLLTMSGGDDLINHLATHSSKSLFEMEACFAHPVFCFFS